MPKWAYWTIGVFAFLWIVGTISQLGEDDPAAGAVPSGTPVVTPSPVASNDFVSPIPKPSDEQAAELLVALGDIEENLGRDKSIDRARNMCESILAEARGEGGTFTLVELVHSRFLGSELTDEQAQAVVDVIANSEWCVDIE